MYLEFDDGYATTLKIPFEDINKNKIADVQFIESILDGEIIGLAVNVYGGWLYTYDVDWAIDMFMSILSHFNGV